MTTTVQERAIHVVNKTKGKDNQQWKQGRRQQAQSFSNKGKDQTCRKCGKSHPPRQCPAFGVSCRKCGKLNHYAEKCESAQATYKKTVHDLSPKIETLFIGTVNIDQISNKSENSRYADLKACDMSIKFKLDTGADTNVLPHALYKSLKRSSCVFHVKNT